MANRHSDSPDGNGSEDSDTPSKQSLIGRRSLLKMAGLAAVTGGALRASSTNSAAASYDTVTVGAGETRRFSVGSGETLENLLIDVSADGAEAVINASGDDWVVRNVGIKGETHDGGDRPIMRATGNGTVEHVYFGDGAALHGTRRVGIIVPGRHAGHIEFDGIHVQGVSSSALYAAGMAREDEGHGTVAVRNSLFRNNNVSHLRLSSDGSVAENVTVYNTNEVPALSSSVGGSNDVVLSRGLYSSYGDTSQTVELRNCDIDVTNDNTCTAGQGYNSCGADAIVSSGGNSGVAVTDCQIKGDVVGDGVNLQSGNGSSPDLTPPEGVPMTAEEAAGGTSSAADGSSGDSTETQTDASKTLSVSGGSPTNKISYSFSVSDSVEKSVAYGGTISSEDTISGTSVEGLVAGGTDSFSFTGDVTAFSLDGDATVSVDGQEVDPDQIVTDETATETETDAPTETETETETETSTDTPTDDGTTDSGSSDEDVLLIDGTRKPEETARYTFDVSGAVTRNVARSTVEDGGMAWDSIDDYVHEGSVVGIVGNGVDAYGYTGRITDIDIRGGATFTVIRS